MLTKGEITLKWKIFANKRQNYPVEKAKLEDGLLKLLKAITIRVQLNFF